MTFDYSIVIRTLGNTGEKYLRMLNAINNQTVKPKEIVVVIPHGYELDHSMGNERVIYSDKGMVTQRAVGIEEAQGEYLLVLDDDLDFPNDFAEKLYAHLVDRDLDCVLAFGDWGVNVAASPKVPFKRKIVSFAKRVRSAYTGQAFFSNKKKSDYFDTITTTAGHHTYVNHEDKLCQAGAFACFFIKSQKAKEVRFKEETWLEKGSISTYAAYDDAVFFYKLFLQHGRIAYTRNTAFIHLDAAAGRPAKDEITAKCIRLYTIAKNRTVFWQRHIWGNNKNLRTLLGGLYALNNYTFYNLVINVWPNNWPAISAMFKGYGDAYRFIKNK